MPEWEELSRDYSLMMSKDRNCTLWHVARIFLKLKADGKRPWDLYQVQWSPLTHSHRVTKASHQFHPSRGGNLFSMRWIYRKTLINIFFLELQMVSIRSIRQWCQALSQVTSCGLAVNQDHKTTSARVFIFISMITIFSFPSKKFSNPFSLLSKHKSEWIIMKYYCSTFCPRI